MDRYYWVLGEALARFAHERYSLGEDDSHHRTDLLGLLLVVP